MYTSRSTMTLYCHFLTRDNATRWKEHGINIPTSIINRWGHHFTNALCTFYNLKAKLFLQSTSVQGTEINNQITYRKGKTHKGYTWGVYDTILSQGMVFYWKDREQLYYVPYMLDVHKQPPPSKAKEKALHYTFAVWIRIGRYAQDKRFNINNKLMEQIISPSTLKRKNYLFCGNDKRTKTNALLHTFIICCRKVSIEPYKWMKEVTLKTLPNMVENATFKPSNKKKLLCAYKHIRAFFYLYKITTNIGCLPYRQENYVNTKEIEQQTERKIKLFYTTVQILQNAFCYFALVG